MGGQGRFHRGRRRGIEKCRPLGTCMTDLGFLGLTGTPASCCSPASCCGHVLQPSRVSKASMAWQLGRAGGELGCGWLLPPALARPSRSGSRRDTRLDRSAASSHAEPGTTGVLTVHWAYRAMDSGGIHCGTLSESEARTTGSSSILRVSASTIWKQQACVRICLATGGPGSDVPCVA
jgi:hypothetical protein